MTLDDALQHGRGNERPFRCPVHEDNNASASVNVLKGVWFCYACKASGTVSGKKAPSTDDLRAMLEPEKAVRVYPESVLELYAGGVGYWLSRFPDWLVWAEQLGDDPFTGAATFPVRTPAGVLAGVGRRMSDEHVEGMKASGGNPMRYRYPRGWSASTTLNGWPSMHRGGVIVLTEGAADRISLTELGIPAYACYGAGLHAPQRELVMRMNPDLVLLGFDMDEAGQRAAGMTALLMNEMVPTMNIVWPDKDPASCLVEHRQEAVLDAVGRAKYGPLSDLGASWHRTVTDYQRRYDEHLEDVA